MKILVVHNKYQQPGGEDEVFRRETDLLRAKGHSVIEYARDNREIEHYPLLRKLTLGPRTIWAPDSVREMRAILANENPVVAHFHNIFPLISPAAYYACAAAHVPVVQTLHNPRLLCPAATLYRDGQVCEECVRKFVPWPAVLHSCYRGSRTQSAVVAAMLATHRAFGTWSERISMYICSTNFYRAKFIEGGLAPEKILCKPHFVPADPGIRTGSGEYALFIGRLAPEKGVQTVIDAWRRFTSRPLKIRGEGPLLSQVQQMRDALPGVVEIVPRIARMDLFRLLKGARFLVWPSLGYYETFGLVAIEALACGVPVLASRIGVMQEIIQDRRTGLHFTPGDSADLAEKVEWAWTHPAELQVMGRNARAEYESKYTSESNYELLMGIYSKAMGDQKTLGFSPYPRPAVPLRKQA